ncbi:MAG TPA: carboxypeptidase-like regulatory domain-containing protein, partial [Edaphobacter sp.]|nr:carboxypeptidase-like regulatory domain-containing protein [Edaphobacter sp.]
MSNSRIRSSLLTLTAATLLALSSTLPASAQNAALGNITGTVRDSAGAVIPDATVVVINTGTGTSRTLTTDSDGHYGASFLQPGQYEVILGGGSFGKIDKKNIAVIVGTTVTVDADLPNASTST